MLLAKGADIDFKGKLDQTALHCAAKGGTLNVVRLLIDAGCDLNSQDKYLCTAIWLAIEAGHREIAKLLAETNGFQDKPDEYGIMAIHAASIKCYPEVVQALVLAKTCNSIEATSQGVNTPLCRCMDLSPGSQRERLKTIEVLLLANARVDAPDPLDDSPLMSASRYDGRELLPLLLEKASSRGVNLRGELGYNALHFAAKCGSLQNIHALIDAGADVSIKNCFGQTALAVARQSKDDADCKQPEQLCRGNEVVSYLEE